MSENPYSASKTFRAAPSFFAGVPNKRRGRLDAVAAIMFALGIFWMRHSARLAEQEAIRLYGRNVDSGAYFDFMIAFYFVPAVVLFSLASITMFRGWRFCRPLHWLAVGWVVVPMAVSLISFVRQVVVAAAA